MDLAGDGEDQIWPENRKKIYAPKAEKCDGKKYSIAFRMPAYGAFLFVF